MFKMLNPRRFYHAVGKKKFLEFILLAVFILFFYGPLLNMLMLAFANEYNVPSVLPQEWGFKWWGYVFGQKSLVSSMIQSFIIAIATTVISMIFCIPAAYSLARFQYPGRKVFMLSFLLTNAFPKLGIYTSIAVLFYKYGLMGTYARKHQVRYHIEKELGTDPPKWTVYFKANQADALTAAFKEYTKKDLTRSTRPSLLTQLHKFKELAQSLGRDRVKNKEHGGPER